MWDISCKALELNDLWQCHGKAGRGEILGCKVLSMLEMSLNNTFDNNVPRLLEKVGHCEPL